MENAFRERGRSCCARCTTASRTTSSSSPRSSPCRSAACPSRRSAAILRPPSRIAVLHARVDYSQPLHEPGTRGDVTPPPCLAPSWSRSCAAAGRAHRAAVVDIEDMALDPDQVVPLAVPPAEAVSNGSPRAGLPAHGPSLSVTLSARLDLAAAQIRQQPVGERVASEGPSRGLGSTSSTPCRAIGGPWRSRPPPPFTDFRSTFSVPAITPSRTPRSPPTRCSPWASGRAH
jgi:hypothetical protein